MSDLIDRQAAIDALCGDCWHDCDKSEFVYDAPPDEQVIICPEHYALSTLPSAQRKGKWYSIGNTGLATCECGYITDRYSIYNYCPKCGARMEKGEEDETD